MSRRDCATPQTGIFVVRANFVDPQLLPAEDRENETVAQMVMSAELEEASHNVDYVSKISPHHAD